MVHRLAGRSAYIEAETRLNQALELFQRLETPWQLGRTYSELGELARLQGQAASARGYFQRALDLFNSIGAAPDAARTRTAMEAPGESAA